MAAAARVVETLLVQTMLFRPAWRQAMMEAFYDAFWFIAVLFVVLFPLAVLMPKDMPGKTAPVD